MIAPDFFGQRVPATESIAVATVEGEPDEETDT